MDIRTEELISILKKDQGLFGKELYKNLMVIEGKESKFDEEDLKRLYLTYVLIYGNKCNSLEELNKNTDLLLQSSKIDKGLENFKTAYNKEEWLQIEQNSQDYYPYKLYASIDNSDLCFVAIQIIEECLKRNRHDFSFKINLKESVNRRDNMVLYCTEENLHFYYNILRLASNKAKFNEPHLLSHNLGENIYGGYDFENGKISYSDKIRDDFYEQLCNSVTPENIANNFYLNLSMNQKMNEIIENGTLTQKKR